MPRLRLAGLCSATRPLHRAVVASLATQPSRTPQALQQAEVSLVVDQAHLLRSLPNLANKIKARVIFSVEQLRNPQRPLQAVSSATWVEAAHRKVDQLHHKRTRPRPHSHPLRPRAILQQTPSSARPSRMRTSNLRPQQQPSLLSAFRQQVARAGTAAEVEVEACLVR